VQSDYFEWDDIKAAKNLAKHGVSFEQAMGVFNDRNAVTFVDEDHSHDEQRELTIGCTFWSDVFIVSHTRRGERIRIISVRRANRAERRAYMTRDGGDNDNNVLHDRAIEDDLRPHYDFDYSKGKRGKYHDGQDLLVIHVRIDPEVAKHYSTGAAVNDALRTMIAEGRAPKPRTE
jgi:uncharacterized DUF497 family protein